MSIAEYEQATLCSDVCNAEAGSAVSFFSVLLSLPFLFIVCVRLFVYFKFRGILYVSLLIVNFGFEQNFILKS